jgi:Cu/Ag efflux protein CusF
MHKRSFTVAAAALLGLAATSPGWTQTGNRTTGLETMLEDHRIVATSCKQVRSKRQVHIKAGARFARAGEVFAFEPRVIRAGRCEEVEIVLENLDSVRHAFMLPGLNPMFILEFSGRETRRLKFVTPDRDVTLKFHCHVPVHERLGMAGDLIVGEGGAPAPRAVVAKQTEDLYQGTGVVIAANIRESRLVVDHEEIKNFMAPMVMSYVVSSAALLEGLKPGAKIRFTIDANKRAIVAIRPQRHQP